jgi:hypothetical protein
VRASRANRADFFQHFIGDLEGIQARRDSLCRSLIRIRIAEAYSIWCAGLEGSRS